MRTHSATAAILIAALSLTLAGCRVEKHGDGDHEDVKIATPFGGMSVKTDDAAVMEGVGLPSYPGAQRVRNDNGKDNNAADVNLSFGSFQLRVRAVEFRTTDTPDQVKAFYRKELTRYGTVIDCVNQHPVGQPERTPEGLTCDNQKGNHISKGTDLSGNHELKAGSEQHQHIVAVDTEGTGTKFGLVALDLPGHLSVDTDEDKSKKGGQAQ
jgi:hypothetical protein